MCECVESERIKESLNNNLCLFLIVVLDLSAHPYPHPCQVNSDGAEAVSQRRIGFRVSYLVTADDTNPDVLNNPLAEGYGH